MSDAVIVIRLEDRASGALDGIDGKAKTLSARFKSLAKNAITRLGAVATATFAVGKAFDTLKNLDQAQAALGTLGVNAQLATAEFAKLSSELKGQASTVELTAAAYDVASAGFATVAEQTSILEAATKGAVGGMSDLNTVGNAVTSVLNSYGMSADQAGKLVDGFIQTQNDGKIIIEQYANQIGRLAPTAAAAGVGIDELNAAISTITAKGVAPEQTITGLNMALVSLLKPSGEAAKLAESLGIEFNEAALKSKGLGGVLQDVVKGTKGSTTQMTKLFGSVDALKAVLALTNDDLKSFNKNLENQANATGAADKAFEGMRKTVKGMFKRLDSAFTNLVASFEPFTPAIVVPMELLAAGIQAVADNFAVLASAASFIGTLAASMKAAAIAQALLAAKTALLAIKTKAAAIASAALQAIMNPANIAKIGLALGAAAGTAALLGKAMGDAAGDAAEGQKELKTIAAEATAALESQPEAIKEATEARKGAIAVAQQNLELVKEETSNIKEQQQVFESAIKVSNARLNAEIEINKMKNQGLEIAYKQATSAKERLKIAAQIFENEIAGAKLSFEKTMLSIKAEQQRLQFRKEAAEIEARVIQAKGKLAALEADSQEKARKILDATRDAVDAQRDQVRLLDKQIGAQKEVAKFQIKAAEAQLEAAFKTAEQNFEQKLVSKEIGKSTGEARKMVKEFSNSVRRALELNNGTARVAGNAQRTSHMFIRVEGSARRAATQIHNAAAAQERFNRAKNQGNTGGGGGSDAPTGQAEGGYNLGSFKAFARGGVVKGPTLGLIGEGGEPEYIIPQSKAAGFAANFLSGKRGASAIPGFAEGGYVGPINITTGPVMQQDGKNYVTTEQFEQGMRDMASAITRNGRSYGARRFAGIS